MSEEDLRRAVSVLDAYRAQLEALSKQSEVVRLSLDEFRRARETVARYRELGKDHEVLVPVGASSYVRAAARDTDRVLVGIGSDLVIEDTAESAGKRLEARIASLEEAARALGARIEEIQARAEAQGDIVDQLYAKTQGAAPG